MSVSDKKSRLGPPARRRSIAEAFIDQDAALADERPKQETVMFNVRLDSNLHRRLKVYAFHRDITMKEIVEELIEGFLDENE